MSHKQTSLELPEQGVFLVTGANGSGKSSLAEGIATAVWGKTLRGSSPWVQDSKGQVTLEAEINGTEYTFTRKATKSGKASVAFEPAPTSYSTNTKAQEAINDISGSFDAWKRCSVFSSQDAAHFTLATDSERKRLLETLLGLDKFDTALGLCRDEHKKILGKIRDLEGDLIRNKTAEERCISEIDYNKSKHAVEKTKVKHHIMTEEELLHKRTILKEQHQEHISVCTQIDQARSKMYGLQAECDSLRKDLLLYAKDECPTCHQPLGGQEIHKLQEDKTQKLSSLEVELRMILDTLESLKEEDKVLGRAISENQAELSKQEAYLSSDNCALVKHLEESIEKASTELDVLRKEARKIKKSMDSLQYELALNENTQKVLGTKGVRSHILTSALEALQLTSNKWLKKITSSSAEILIRPYSETKAGARRDAISLEVKGIGDDKGYKALSGGQRRRVDVALLLGLAELAQATDHKSKGTVFFDEVFDSLDEEGTSLVSGIIEEMSEDRLVVVISHSPELVAGLSVTQHAHVHEGEVSLM